MFDYLQKFNTLPAGLKTKISAPSVMTAISDLEKKYQVDLAMLVMKVMIKDLNLNDLVPYFINENGLRPVMAENLVRELREKVFTSVADYLNLRGGRGELDANYDIQDLIKKFGISLPSSHLISRLQNIINIYLKGVRNRIDTKNTLAKNVKIGGLGLNSEEIDKILKICDRQQVINKQLGLVNSRPLVAEKNKESLVSQSLHKQNQSQEPVIKKTNNSFSKSGHKLSQTSSVLNLKIPKYDLKQEIASGRFKELRINPPEKELNLSEVEPELKLKSPQSKLKLEISNGETKSKKNKSETLNSKKQESKINLQLEDKKLESSADPQVNKSPVISRSFKKPSFWSKFGLNNKKTLKNKKDLNTKKTAPALSTNLDLGIKDKTKDQNLKDENIKVNIKSTPELATESVKIKKQIVDAQSKKRFLSSSPEVVLDKSSELKNLIASAQKLVSKKSEVPRDAIKSDQLLSKSPSKDLSPSSNPKAQSKQKKFRPAPSSAAKRPSMHDIKARPKVMGPIEELQFLDVVNFRRLSKNPEEATDKILTKIKLLEEDGYSKMVEGVLAWRKSPINRLYLHLGQGALKQGVSLKDYVLKKQAANQEYLTWEEISALVALNSKLIF